ncbi:MAG: DNA repair protein RadC [bacterium]
MLEEVILKVKELPNDDRPREKLIIKGVKSLSDAELIAIILRTGLKGKNVVELSQDLLNSFGGINNLALQSIDSLTNCLGIGKDKAATILAAFEIGRRSVNKTNVLLNRIVVDAKIVADFFIPLLKDEIKETFWVVCLNAANKIIKYEKISTGILNEVVAHPREVFKSAIINNAAKVILLHNHPSGSISVSQPDVSLTCKLKEAGDIIGISIVDHIIVAGNSFVSLKDKKVF